MYSDTAIGGKGLPSTSDKRLKTIVADVVLPLDTVAGAPLKSFFPEGVGLVFGKLVYLAVLVAAHPVAERSERLRGRHAEYLVDVGLEGRRRPPESTGAG